MAQVPPKDRLERLRQWRNPPDSDLSLAFLHNQFKHDIARPHKQLAQWIQLWERLVPAPLRDHTRLLTFSRGILRVGVDSSAQLYELDRLLRAGLERELIRQSRAGVLRKIQLQVESA